MVKFSVIEKGPDGDPSGIRPHGSLYFIVVPRIGETLSIMHSLRDVQVYEVIQIIHHSFKRQDELFLDVGVIYVKHIGSEHEFRAGMNDTIERRADTP